MPLVLLNKLDGKPCCLLVSFVFNLHRDYTVRKGLEDILKQVIGVLVARLTLVGQELTGFEALTEVHRHMLLELW